MSSTYYQLSDVPETAPLPVRECHTCDDLKVISSRVRCPDCNPAPLVLLPVQAQQDRAKPGTPRLATLHRELDKLNKQYYRAGSGSRRRRIEARIKAVTAAIAAHPKAGKG